MQKKKKNNTSFSTEKDKVFLLEPCWADNGEYDDEKIEELERKWNGGEKVEEIVKNISDFFESWGSQNS